MLTVKTVNKYRVVRLSPIISGIRQIADFPGSSASDRQYLDITLMGLQNTFPTWLALMEHLAPSNQVQVSRASEKFQLNPDVLEMRRLLDTLGSDKGTKHQYDLVYSNLMSNYKNDEVAILEIGLGTNNTDVPSNMGKLGKPGASLRAWRDYFVNGQIVGCDIDPRILFTEDRITTFELDQTNDLSWSNLLKNLQGKKFNLVIDDGLHSPFANLMSLKYSLELLTPGGVLVIEDISEYAIPLWKLIAVTVYNACQIEIVQTKNSYVVICKPN